MEIWNKLQNDEVLDDWTTNSKIFLYYKGRLAIANNYDLQEAILIEAHISRFTIHPGSTKIYQDMKRQY